MFQTWVFSNKVNVILIFPTFSNRTKKIASASFCPYRKREHLAEAQFSKSGLINVTLTLHLSNKLTFKCMLKQIAGFEGEKKKREDFSELFLRERLNTCSHRKQRGVGEEELGSWT